MHLVNVESLRFYYLHPYYAGKTTNRNVVINILSLCQIAILLTWLS